MAKTVIVVAVTETDQYGNLQVTAKEGGIVKIAKKREHLFGLFQQGKAVELDWQTYMNKDYVADARLVEGALPEPTDPPTDMHPPRAPETGQPSGQATGMVTNKITDMRIARVQSKGSVTAILYPLFGRDATIELLKWWRSQFLGITKIKYSGESLPQYDKEKE